MRRATVWMLPAVMVGALACGLVLAPAASAASSGATVAPLAFLGPAFPAQHHRRDRQGVLLRFGWRAGPWLSQARHGRHDPVSRRAARPGELGSCQRTGERHDLSRHVADAGHVDGLHAALLDGGPDRRGPSGERDLTLRWGDWSARHLPLACRADSRGDEHPHTRDPRLPGRRERTGEHHHRAVWRRAAARRGRRLRCVLGDRRGRVCGCPVRVEGAADRHLGAGVLCGTTVHRARRRYPSSLIWRGSGATR